MNLRAIPFALSALLSAGLISGCAGYQSAVPLQPGSNGANVPDFTTPSACSWKLKTSPNPSSTNYLSGVSGSSSSDVWAVGYSYSPSTYLQTLALKWNGDSWSQVTTPDPGAYGNGLFAVAALSATDAWAVGQQSTVSVNQPLILRWNGKVWKPFSVAPVKSGSARLYSISAISSKDIWAIGAVSTDSGKAQPYAIHWDGKNWKAVTMPNPGTYGSAIGAVAAHSSNDVWGTGGTYTNASLSSFVTLAEHWNGTKWSVVKTPNANKNDNVFNAAVDLSSKDAWAIGDYYTGSVFASLTEHWNGTKWTIVKSPNVKKMGVGLAGATAFSASDVWAVGSSFAGSAQSTVSLHWNGKAWSIVKSPNLSAPDGFNAVAGIPKSKTIWAVGASIGSGSQTLTAQNTCAD